MSKNCDTIVVRKAVAADVKGVFKLIKELCYLEGEKPEDVMTINESVLLEDGFGDNASYKCIVAEDTSIADDTDQKGCRIVGHAIFSYSYSAWKGKSIYLDDFIVKKEYRGMGIGKSIMRKLAEFALENNCKMVFFCCTKGNTPAEHLYETVGTNCIDRWNVHYWEKSNMRTFLDSN